MNDPYDWTESLPTVSVSDRRRQLLVIVVASVFMPCLPLLFISRVLASLWVGGAVALTVLAVYRIAALSRQRMRAVVAKHGWDDECPS